MGAVLITTPQMVAVDDVTRELTFCRRTRISILGIIENMSGFVCPTCSECSQHRGFAVSSGMSSRHPMMAVSGRKDLECSNILASGGGEQLAEKAKVTFLGRIPIDPTLSRCTEEGLNYIDKFSNSPISQMYHSIITKLIRQTDEEMEVVSKVPSERLKVPSRLANCLLGVKDSTLRNEECTGVSTIGMMSSLYSFTGVFKMDLL
ncbi:Cytosolic Fe-S cluster assembly factor NUBP2 [Portunus trituberculatus]|uniref:Cytosolic Fe-S cluster assembly factor NUBP2 n=1 Tax=Portunus trituberculatus TaxID=210409 RepID=A0A5B7EHU9_PORTR|nr:Cytosolic Fe-S cluster assembly factor NUBP2 [Portunus trituberculatus]